MDLAHSLSLSRSLQHSEKKEKSLNEMDHVKTVSFSPVGELVHERSTRICSHCAPFYLKSEPCRCQYEKKYSRNILELTGLVKAQVGSHRPAEAWVQSLVSLCVFYCGKNDTVTSFPLSTSGFPCHYHSANVLYSIF